jgi:hypothetical protein
MWDELAKDNRVLDLVYQNSLYARFHREDWNPKNESLRSFVTRLKSYRTELSSTNNQITDQQLVSRILQALPSESVWQQAKLFALQENRDFPTTVTLLQTYENSLAPTPSKATTTASIARDTHLRERGRGRNRGRGKGRRGRWHKSDKHDKSKGRVEKVGKDQCMFCHKKGHYIKDCF